MNPRQTVDLKVKGKTIRLLEENIGEYLYDLGFGSGFFKMTPKVWTTKEK